MPSVSASVGLCVLVALCVTGSLALPSSRILGGDAAAIGTFQYAVSVRVDGVHVCGGTIINEHTILTAAHCLFNKNVQVAVSRVSVRVGSTNQFAGGQIVYPSSALTHPSYGNYQNNLALLKLSTALVWSDRIQSIPYFTASSQVVPVGSYVTAAGWGEQSDDGSAYKLHYTTFTVATEEVCLDAYSAADGNVVCLAHALQKGSCTGDAGNGAVYDGRLMAVANFVVGACGARYPDVFTNVAPYADWISQNSA